jgi:hypothetical protein
VLVVGGESPSARIAKGLAVVRRAVALRRLVRHRRPDVAFSHGSYSQLVVARANRIPAVTMMDYEHQPANHFSFRLAQRVIVPDVFPESALRRFGAGPHKVIRYPGFKEELYLTGFEPDPNILEDLGLDRERTVAVFRPPPEGALYHRTANERFDGLLRLALQRDDVQVVLLPRTSRQRERYTTSFSGLRIPNAAIDGTSLLALADLTVGAGGTMNRESAVLGTPTYTVFHGRLAVVDAELIRLGRLHDLRYSDESPRLEKKSAEPRGWAANANSIMAEILGALQKAGDPGPGVEM